MFLGSKVINEARIDFCQNCKEKGKGKICRSCKAIYQKHLRRARKKLQPRIGHIDKNPQLDGIICLECNFKKIKEFCPDCSKNYIRYKDRCKYHNKSKAEVEERKRKRKEYYQNSIKRKNTNNKSGGRSKKTVSRKIKKVLHIIDTPKGETSVKVLQGVLEKSKEEVKKALHFEENKPDVDIAAEIFEKQKQNLQVKSKSEQVYQLGNSYKEVIQNQSLRTIAKKFKVGRKKSKELKRGQAKRKPSSKCITNIQEIVEFYKQDDVSRIDANIGTTTKKWGPRRYMMMKLKDAHKKFQKEKNTKLSFSKFAALKPINIRSYTKIPHEVCLCVYCDNIRNKIEVIKGCNTGPSNTKPSNVYELYHDLMCPKEKGKLPNINCAEKNCNQCQDWETKIKDIYKDVDMNKKLSWIRWVKSEYTNSENEVRTRREPVKRVETTQVCIEELVEDVIKPTKQITFIRHYFNQIYQTKQYKNNKENLDIQECLIVQDFSKNRQIVHQDEIKSQYFAKKSVTMHPSVCYVKLNEDDPPKRIVISHFSDITDHDSHMVNYITKDTIKILQDMFQIQLTTIYIWSDGCSSQYKGKNSFYYLSKMQNVQRHYFGSEHGKGE